VELPRLEPLYQKYRDAGLQIVAVERSRDREGAEKFFAENELSYTLLENGEGDAEVVKSLFGIRWFPTSFLVDQNGKIVRAHVGFEAGDEEKLEAEIQSLLAIQS
jgi:glutathione peroxidase-family protein